MMKGEFNCEEKTIQVAAIATVLSGIVISPLFTLANGKGDVFESEGVVEFIPSTDPQGPVDPTDPDQVNPVNPVNLTDPDPVNPVNSVKPTNSQGVNIGTDSPLSLGHVSNLDFGVSEISSTKKDVTHYANAQKLRTSEGSTYVSNYVQSQIVVELSRGGR